jgi:single-strand DNA-binding protein
MAAANINKVFLLGNLTRDPELRYLPSGTAVADLGLAVNRSFKDAQGDRKRETCFVDVTFWGKSAEICNQYLTKGRPVFIEGRLKLDRWESPEGKRSRIRVVADSFQFIDAPPAGKEAGPEGDRSYVSAVGPANDPTPF